MNQHPLILVFYLDSELMANKDIIVPFIQSVDNMIKDKNANMMAFFLPTNGPERIECINPTIISEPDMEKINTMIQDIKNKFSITGEELEDKNCQCKNNGNCKCKNN